MRLNSAPIGEKPIYSETVQSLTDSMEQAGVTFNAQSIVIDSIQKRVEGRTVDTETGRKLDAVSVLLNKKGFEVPANVVENISHNDTEVVKICSDTDTSW